MYIKMSQKFIVHRSLSFLSRVWRSHCFQTKTCWLVLLGAGFKDSRGKVNAWGVHNSQNRCEVLLKYLPNASEPEVRSSRQYSMYTYNSHTWKSTEDIMKWESWKNCLNECKPKPQCHIYCKTSQELRMLSPSLSIQRSQCNCPYCCSQLSEM